MKMRWQTIASSVSIRTISPTATPLPTAYDCVAVYIAGHRTNLIKADNQKNMLFIALWFTNTILHITKSIPNF